MLGLFSSIGGYEILIILAVILLLFGGKKLPELARGLGKGIREFKKELHGVKNVDDEIDDEKQLTKEEDPYNHKDDADGDKA